MNAGADDINMFLHVVHMENEQTRTRAAKLGLVNARELTRTAGGARRLVAPSRAA